MQLPFYKLCPGGNPTLLFPLCLPQEQRMAVANACLSPLHLHAEQAGFVHPQKAELTMAGGEFCLNATRCMALVLALEGRLPVTQQDQRGEPLLWQGEARVSGLLDAVTLRVRRIDKSYWCAVSLPLVALPSIEDVQPGFTLVRLSGITHLLVDAHLHAFSTSQWAEEAASLRARFSLENEPAVGCIWWKSRETPPSAKPQARACHWEAHPVVRVREPFSLCYESSCGSGALALALALYKQGADKDFCIHQPSGLPLHVRLHEEALALRAEVDGPVSLTAKGTTEVDMARVDTALTSTAE